MGILQTLLGRKAQRLRECSSEWQAFVCDVAEKRITDADEMLTTLQRLGKTPADLERLVERVLPERRSDREKTLLLAEGESKLEAARQKLAAIEEERRKVLEKIEAKELAASLEHENAVRMINEANDARRRLLEGASDESREGAFGSLAAERVVAVETLNHAERVLRDREDWIGRVRGYGESAASEDLERLPSKVAELSSLQSSVRQAKSEVQRIEQALQQAEEFLLQPEAGI